MQTPPTATMIELSAPERKLISLIAAKHVDYTVKSVERRSNRPFDVSLEGVYKHYNMPTVAFRAWLPLAAIQHLTDWANAPIALMSDYPLMAELGDWSAIRDSSDGATWIIFDKFARPLAQPELDYMAKIREALGNYAGCLEIELPEKPGYRRRFAVTADAATPKQPHLSNASIAHFYPTAKTLKLGWGTRKNLTVRSVQIR